MTVLQQNHHQMECLECDPLLGKNYLSNGSRDPLLGRNYLSNGSPGDSAQG